MPPVTRRGRATKTAAEVGRTLGFRSGLEGAISEQLDAAMVSAEYETYKIPYRPEKDSHYTPDFTLPNGIIVETKGRFVTADRTKHRLVQKQHPDLDIRFVFSNPNARISKTSKTTYAMWCASQGFQYAAKRIPAAWLAERTNHTSLAAIQRLKEKKA